jgi:hypothetical protein
MGMSGGISELFSVFWQAIFVRVGHFRGCRLTPVGNDGQAER